MLTSLDIVVLSVQVSGCRGGGRERERGGKEEIEREAFSVILQMIGTLVFSFNDELATS